MVEKVIRFCTELELMLSNGEVLQDGEVRGEDPWLRAYRTRGAVLARCRLCKT